MDPVLSTAPVALPVDLASAKRHVRETSDEEDAYIAGLIAAATDHFDGATGILGLCLSRQGWTEFFPGFAGPLVLTLGPVISLDSVQYRDGDGVLQTVTGARVVMQGRRAVVCPAVGESWPAAGSDPDAVQITYTAGHDVVPAALQQAILLTVGHWFVNREAVVMGAPQPLPMGAMSLVQPYRRILV